VVALTESHFEAPEIVDMPANNLMLVFGRRSS
jgi:hypothetical protein